MRILMKILWFCSAFIHCALSRHSVRTHSSHSPFSISISCYCAATIELCALQVVVAAICIIVIAIVVLAFINVKT